MSVLGEVLKRYRERLSRRKLRLLACACIRRVPSARSGSSGQAIDLAERFADGRASAHDLAQARYSGRFRPGHAAWAVCWGPENDDWAMLERALAWSTGLASHSAHSVLFRREEEAQAELVREIGGPTGVNPVIAPIWRAWSEGAVVQLARAIYEERSFEQMPILADALEEAGCADETILRHCRQPQGHVRGCWLLDAVLELA